MAAQKITFPYSLQKRSPVHISQFNNIIYVKTPSPSIAMVLGHAKHLRTTKYKTTLLILTDEATDLAPMLGTKLDVVCSSLLAANTFK